MNPFKPPKSDSAGTESETPGPANLGHACSECGSTNTANESALKTKPSLIAVILFGWVFILLRAALGKKSEVCRDCGAMTSFRTAGNYIALAIVVLLTFMIVVAIIAGEDPTGY